VNFDNSEYWKYQNTAFQWGAALQPNKKRPQKVNKTEIKSKNYSNENQLPSWKQKSVPSPSGKNFILATDTTLKAIFFKNQAFGHQATVYLRIKSRFFYQK